jgi:acyl-phosphate glycerol 3-phosphate acyltransferase
MRDRVRGPHGPALGRDRAHRIGRIMRSCAIAALLGYAIGSIPTGYLVVRWRSGGDVRTMGSGSTGGRNVTRQLGLAWGLTSGLGDVAKGAFAVILALRIAPAGWPVAIPAAVAGHVWSPVLGFRGGRGIAPAAGAVLVAVPVVALGRSRSSGVAWATIASIGLVTGALVVAGHAPRLRRLLHLGTVPGPSS